MGEIINIQPGQLNEKDRLALTLQLMRLKENNKLLVTGLDTLKPVWRLFLAEGIDPQVVITLVTKSFNVTASLSSSDAHHNNQ